ncbi:MAG TPA: 2-phospho-L-lactate guanylyltransferase [Solirubrobacteraceae bacterium]|jgi:2-phospho-L-lactate guanylyltransferase|nr:2-phospho-L-lactate guanylyltransferase [Solirubrobacteraceae bacterium]
MRTVAILPVKTFSHAKQRLDAGIAAEPRRALAEAMFADVLVALRRAHAVEATLVVSSDRGAQRIATAHGAIVLEDDLDRGHSPAAAKGVALALEHGAERALLVPGDCPLLDPDELDELLARPVHPPSALIVPDRHGTGTNALVLTPPGSLEPSFGPGSCERHLATARLGGTAAEVVHVPTLALDVDTPEDLDAVAEALDSKRGGAARTRGALIQLLRAGS